MNPQTDLFETPPMAHDQSEAMKVVLGCFLQARCNPNDWLTDVDLWAALRMCGLNVCISSIGARRRDLRKPQYGGHRIEGRVRKGCPGVWEYRLVDE